LLSLKSYGGRRSQSSPADVPGGCWHIGGTPELSLPPLCRPLLLCTPLLPLRCRRSPASLLRMAVSSAWSSGSASCGSDVGRRRGPPRPLRLPASTFSSLAFPLPSAGGDSGAAARPRSCSRRGRGAAAVGSLPSQDPSRRIRGPAGAAIMCSPSTPTLSLSLSFPLLARSGNDDARWDRRQA
jgi:hypothetical protein